MRGGSEATIEPDTDPDMGPNAVRRGPTRAGGPLLIPGETCWRIERATRFLPALVKIAIRQETRARRFLRWAEDRDPDLAMGWRLLAATGTRRGEALALPWRDVDLDAGRLQVRRSVGEVKTMGSGKELVEGPTETGQARVVDIDSDTVAARRAHRATRGSLSLELVRNDALVLGTRDGTNRHPERYSRRFVEEVMQARKALGQDQLPRIRLHDLRHTTRRFCSPPASR